MHCSIWWGRAWSRQKYLCQTFKLSGKHFFTSKNVFCHFPSSRNFFLWISILQFLILPFAKVAIRRKNIGHFIVGRPKMLSGFCFSFSPESHFSIHTKVLKNFQCQIWCNFRVVCFTSISYSTFWSAYDVADACDVVRHLDGG